MQFIAQDISNPEFSYQVLRKDGAVRDVSVSIALVRDSAGTPIGFRGILQRYYRTQASGGTAETGCENGSDRETGRGNCARLQQLVDGHHGLHDHART